MKKRIIQILAVIILLLTLNSCADIQEAAEDCLDSSSDCYVKIEATEPEPEPESEPYEPEVVVVIDATADVVVEIEAETEEEEVEIVAVVEVEVEIEIAVSEPEPEPEPISLTFLTGGTLYFYDGQFVEQPNVNPVNCGPRCFTDGNQRIYYDELGEIVSSETLIVEYDLVVDDWAVERIDPETAQAQGGMLKDYSQIYLQGVAVGHWSSNQWYADDLIKTLSGDYIAMSGNIFHALTAVVDINHADKLLIHTYDAVNRTAVIENEAVFSVSWATNYFNNAREWIKAGSVWYSWNGYELETDLTENANALWAWNIAPYPVDIPESPTLLGVGTNADETVLYFIECNSGYLTRYIPESDSLEIVFRLYIGDGLRLSGIASKETINAAMIGNFLYFADSGSTWILDLESGIVGLFFGGVGEVEAW